MKSAAYMLLVVALLGVSTEALAGRYVSGNAHRVGVRNAGMGGNHVALQGDLSAALINPAGLLQSKDATVFSAEGFLADGPDFDTRGGRNVLQPAQDSPPLLLGFSTTYNGDYAFALFDGLRYDSRYTGRLLSVDTASVEITDYQEEVRLNTAGLALAARPFRGWVFGLAIYLDRQKVFKRVDYTPVSPEFVFEDYEAFGTASALHGGVGIIWSPRGKMSYAVAFQTEVDLANNLTVHTFQDNIVPTEDNPNNFFRESSPESFDKFPWSVTGGIQHRWRPDRDIFADVALVGWGTDPNRRLLASVSLGGEWRFKPGMAARAGFYTQADTGDFSSTPGRTEEDLRLLDLRTATTSSYSDKNSEVFLTGGFGVQSGYFKLDASIEDSHLISDFGRTIFKLGLTAVLPSR